MNLRTTCILALAALLVGPFVLLASTQEAPLCRPLDNTAALRFVPPRVPFESDSVPVDERSIAALEFPDKARIAIAPLMTSGTMKQRYEFVVFSESRFVLGGTPLPSGLIGLAFEPAERGAATRTVVARDFTGAEIGRFCMELDSKGATPAVALVPTGGKTFELRIGTYAVEGTQK